MTLNYPLRKQVLSWLKIVTGGLTPVLLQACSAQPDAPQASNNSQMPKPGEVQSPADNGEPAIKAQNTKSDPAALNPLMKGRILYARCQACHTLEEGGKHLVGPNLYDIMGKQSGTRSGFVYSKAMREAAIIWDDQTLSDYLENPAAYVPKGRMVFVGLRNEMDRRNVIEYIKSKTLPNYIAPDWANSTKTIAVEEH